MVPPMAHAPGRTRQACELAARNDHTAGGLNGCRVSTAALRGSWTPAPSCSSWRNCRPISARVAGAHLKQAPTDTSGRPPFADLGKAVATQVEALNATISHAAIPPEAAYLRTKKGDSPRVLRHTREVPIAGAVD